MPPLQTQSITVELNHAVPPYQRGSVTGWIVMVVQFSCQGATYKQGVQGLNLTRSVLETDPRPAPILDGVLSLIRLLNGSN